MTLIKCNRPRHWTNYFEDFIENDFSFENTKLVPKTNIQDFATEFKIDLAIPGYKKEEIDINLENSVLTVSSERQDDNTNENFTRREFVYKSFSRSFNLPKNVNIDKIKASFEDGLLNISLPKFNEDKTKISKKINIS